MVFSDSFTCRTSGFTDIVDLSADVARIVQRSGASSGILTVSVPGSTASITTIEYESGAVEDLRNAIDRIASRTIPYAHDERWGDGNGFAHVRAALIGPSIALPLVHGELQMGTWQQIVLVDFDNRPRTRTIIVQIVGE